jgi:DNA-binding response OmpR family regulator
MAVRRSGLTRNTQDGEAVAMTAGLEALGGLRILVAEDVDLLAEVIRDELEDYGCSVVGPAVRLADAMALAREEALDGAILDVNLRGQLSFPVAGILRARGVPYVFLTGYDDYDRFPVEYRGAPRLGKPYRNWEFAAVMAAHLRRS